MNLILAVPDLNDTQFVEAVRAKVGPDAVILAANGPRICGLQSIGNAEPLPPKELTEEFLFDTGYNPVKPIPSRRGRRFADYNYHEKNFNRFADDNRSHAHIYRSETRTQMAGHVQGNNAQLH